MLEKIPTEEEIENWRKRVANWLQQEIPNLSGEGATALITEYENTGILDYAIRSYTETDAMRFVEEVKDFELRKVWNPKGLATVTFEVSGLWHGNSSPTNAQFQDDVARSIVRTLVPEGKHPNLTYDISSVTASITGSLHRIPRPLYQGERTEFSRIVKERILDSFGVPDDERSLWGIEVFMMEGSDFATAVVRKYRESTHDNIDPDSANYYVSDVKTKNYEIISTLVRKNQNV